MSDSLCLPDLQCFNPRLRTGGDVEILQGLILAAVVSIHASAREATA